MSSTRLAACFERCKSEERAALIGYLTAGDPDPAGSDRLLAELATHCDIVEIGMPFSDPMADGPVIQLASERALASGTKSADVFHLAAELRAANPELGIVLMGYGNTAYAMGYEAFAEQAAKAGVDGVLIVDIPPEESGEIDAALAARAISPIRLLSPTSSDERIALAAESAGGFIYFVSLTGVTGAAMGDTGEIGSHIERIRARSGLPVCVGFGIKSPEQAAKVAAMADGVVVGSHFVTQIAEHEGNIDAMVTAVGSAAGSIRAALKREGKS